MISQSSTSQHVEQRSTKILSPLRYQRLLRGWTQQEVADALYKLCSAAHHPDAGINANMVGRWEVGYCKPSLFYQKHLCALYELTADKLGLLEVQA